MTTVDEAKRAAGEAAVDRTVRDGTCVGLGTGSTALWAIRRVGERVAAGSDLVAVATSRATEALCSELRIPLVPLGARPIDVAIDGADEVAPDWSLTKGGGGALFREKAVALEAARFVVVVDESKLVERLGAFPVPIEVVPFSIDVVAREIAAMHPGVTVRRRERDGAPFVTDNGNAILDCAFGPIDGPDELDAEIRALHGVVASGVFVGLTDAVFVAGAGGVREL